MFTDEPHATALLLATVGLLLMVAVILSRTARRAGLPVALLFLVLGMAAGSEGLGHISLHDYGFVFRLGTCALTVILFDGGLNTPLSAAKLGLRPAAVLATFGVIGTAALAALGAHLLGLPWGEALWLGAVVSSTDAAAVFSVLRGSGVQLKRRVGVTLELESGLNDPMAFILTLALTRSLVQGAPLGWALLGNAALQLGVGLALGISIGYLGAWMLERVQLPAGGLYPVLTLALAFLAFGVPTLFQGSGFLAVYVAAMVLGNRAVRYRSSLLRVHDAMAWLAQVVMFLALGLLVTPSELLPSAGLGLGVALFLALLARPLMVWLCLLPFGYPLREVAFIGWVGLRGAVPIILATIPVLMGAPGAHHVFNVVFFVVVVNAVIPGATVRAFARRLGLVSSAPPPPALLEIASTRILKGELLSFFISRASAVSGASLSDLPFPEQAAAMLIIRGDELLAPRGDSVLTLGDHLYVICRAEDRPFVELLFGSPEDE